MASFERPPDVEVVDPLVVLDLQLPTTPYGVVRAEYRGPLPDGERLVVTGPAGPVEMELQVEWTSHREERGYHIWIPLEPFGPGVYRVESVFDVPASELGETTTFEVTPFGLDPDAAPLRAGDGIRLDLRDGVFLAPLNFGDVLMEYVRFDLVLEVMESHEDRFEFRVIQRGDADGACSALQGVASVDATGHVRWEAESLPFQVDGIDAVVEDASFEFGLLGEGAGAARLRARVDTRAFDGLGVPLCDLDTLGVESCVPCGSGEPTCVEGWLEVDRLERIALPWSPGAPFSPCLVDVEPFFDEDAPPLPECTLPSCRVGSSWTWPSWARRR